MSEIITIHIGQCGSQMGLKFWEMLTAEHDIDATGHCTTATDAKNQRLEVFFAKTANNTFRPRALFVDLDSAPIESIRDTPIGRLLDPESYVYGQMGTGKNWAKGYYTIGAELIDRAWEAISSEVEKCANLQGFIITHSLGGGTGAGMGSLIISKLRQEYPDKVIATFSVFPSTAVSYDQKEPYNTVLAIKNLGENADMVFVLDNDALYKMGAYHEKTSSPTLSTLNNIITAALSNVTAPLRFPTKGENCLSTLQEMVKRLRFVMVDVNAGKTFHIRAVTMLRKVEAHHAEIAFHKQAALNEEKLIIYVPVRLPLFLDIALIPIASKDARAELTADSIKKIFGPNHSLTTIDRTKEQFGVTVGIFRGKITKNVTDSFVSFKKTLQIPFTRYHMPSMELQTPETYNMPSIELPTPQQGTVAGLTVISNHTAMQKMLERFSAQYTLMLQREQYLANYIGEGMDAGEFTEAKSCLKDLFVEYQVMGMNDIVDSDVERDDVASVTLFGVQAEYFILAVLGTLRKGDDIDGDENARSCPCGVFPQGWRDNLRLIKADQTVLTGLKPKDISEWLRASDVNRFLNDPIA